MKRLMITIVCILLFFTIICPFSLMTRASAASTSNAIFLSGSGLDANNGASPETAVGSLTHAVELLNGNGGTIVLCGDLQETTGITIPAQTGKLYITSSFNGVNYDATLSFGGSQNQANKNLVFQSEAEINNITINYNLVSSVSNKLLTIYTGPSLTIGTGVVTSHTDESGNINYEDTKITIRGGTNIGDSDQAQLAVYSGNYKYILAGNNVGTISTSNIYIGGTTNVLEFVQCGGIGKTVTNVNVEIDGGTITKLYVDGYNHTSISVNIEINGGEIQEILDRRLSCSSDISTQLSLSLYDEAISRIKTINLEGDHSGTKNLYVNTTYSSGVTVSMPVFLNADFSQWDNVQIGDNTILYLNCIYSDPATSLSVGSGGMLMLTEEVTLPSNLATNSNVSIAGPVVFVDPINGDDENYGRSLPYPVKTWAQALTVMDGHGGTLVLCGDVVAVAGSPSTSTIQVNVPMQDKNTKITSVFGGENFGGRLILGDADNDSKIILCFTSNTTIENTVIQYTRPNGSGTSSEIWSGPSLTIGAGVHVVATGTDNQITLRTGLYDANIAEAKLNVMSGTWNYVQGGNSKYPVDVSILSFGGTAVTQYVQCGGTNASVGTSVVDVSGGTIMKALYINGYGSSSKHADLETSQITISGGTIVAIYDARNTYGEITDVTVTITGTGADGIEYYDLKYKDTITGTKSLIFDQAQSAVVKSDFSQWDVVNVCDNSTVVFFDQYVSPQNALIVEQGSTVLLNALHNSAEPSYQGLGTVSVTSTISRAHSDYTESLFMALDNQKLADGTDVDKEQGMALWGNELFVMQNNGVCKVYDLLTRSSTPIATFNLGSYNEGSPTTDYSNHCNTVMFGTEFYTDPTTNVANTIPLLYVRTGNAADADTDGYIARLAVENVVRSQTNGTVSYSAQTLQTIIYSDYYDGNKTVEDYNSSYNTNYVAPSGFGAPMWLVDDSTDSLYILSAKYRTTYGSVGQTDTYPGYNSVADNYYVITKFDLPELSEGSTIILTPMDIEDQFTTEFAAFSTQGGTLYNHKIIYTFGFGQISALNPNKILVFDLQNKRISNSLELSNSMFAFDEIEACVVYNGKLLVNTQGGYVYELSYSED